MAARQPPGSGIAVERLHLGFEISPQWLRQVTVAGTRGGAKRAGIVGIPKQQVLVTIALTPKIVEQRGGGFAGIGSFQSDLLRLRENPHCGHALRGEDRIPLAEKSVADFYPCRSAIE